MKLSDSASSVFTVLCEGTPVRKGFLRVTTLLVAVVVIGLVAVGFWGHGQIAGSLPLIDGTRRLRNLSAEVTIERDSLGIPTIRAANRLDLAKATGFLHAQDRFFQMDLLRRNSAGELSALVGPSQIEADKKVRVHRFRQAAGRVLAAASDEDRAIVDAYAAGEPETLRHDFLASLKAAFAPDEIRDQLAAADLKELKVRLVSDRHVLVAGTMPG